MSTRIPVLGIILLVFSMVVECYGEIDIRGVYYVDHNETWGSTDNVYVLKAGTEPNHSDDGHVIIRDGATLTILPGTAIYQEGPYSYIRVASEMERNYGKLIAVGTPDQRILFAWDLDRPNQPYIGNGRYPDLYPLVTGTYSDGQGSYSMEFRYCDFTSLVYGVAAGSPHDGDRITVADCRFTDCGVGVDAQIWADHGRTLEIVRSDFRILHTRYWMWDDIYQRHWQEFIGIAARSETATFLISNCTFVSDSIVDVTPWGEQHQIEKIILVPGWTGQGGHQSGHFGPASRIQHCYFDTRHSSIALSYNSRDVWMNSTDWFYRYDGPMLVNNFFDHAAYTQSLDRLNCGLCKNNLTHWPIEALNWRPDGCDIGPTGENWMNLNDWDEVADLFAPNSLHLKSTDAVPHPLDGINEGTDLGVTKNRDLDGSTPDIGIYGGPFAADLERDPLHRGVYVELSNATPQNCVFQATIEDATYHISQNWKVPSGIHSSLGKGGFLADPGVILNVGANASLNASGADDDSVIFQSTHAGQRWGGIQIVSSDESSIFAQSRISDADIGVVLADNFTANDLTVSNCGTGIAVKNLDPPYEIRSGGLKVEGCGTGIQVVGKFLDLAPAQGGVIEITHNLTGIRASFKSFVSFRSVTVSHNTQTGVYVEQSAANLSWCTIQDNGDGWSPLHGGVALSASSSANLKCCTITQNHGPGVGVHDGTLTMQDMPATPDFGGNDISNNSWPGQLYISPGRLLMDGGVNRVSSPGTSPLIRLTGSVAHVNGNNWGYAANHEAEILQRLLPATSFSTNDFTYLPTWSACSTPVSPGLTTCAQLWDDAVRAMKDGSYSIALDKFKTIIREYPDCDHAKTAASQLLAAERMLGTDVTAIRDTLLSIKETTTSAEVACALAQGAAEAAAIGTDYATAASELSAMLDTLSGMDSVSVMMSLGGVRYLEAISDTTDTLTESEHLGIFFGGLDSLESVAFEGACFGPTLLHTPPAALTAAQDTVVLTAKSYAEDGVPIAAVAIDYRMWPEGSWVHDELRGPGSPNDSLWDITLWLDKMGGALQYRLMAIDTMGRVEVWPSDGGYPDLGDTLTYYVSFESQADVVEKDTAYVYAPGRLTHNMRIGSDGVVMVLPSPSVEAPVLLADRNVGFDVQGGQLMIQGTAETDLVITALDSAELWNGVTDEDGLVEMSHAVVSYCAYPMSCDAREGKAKAHIDSSRFEHVSKSVELISTISSGSDCTFVTNTTISGVSQVGLYIQDGNAELDHVTIQDCEKAGVFIEMSDNPQSVEFHNSLITHNAGSGIYLWPSTAEQTPTVVLKNCEISFNADTASEIDVPEHGYVKMNNGAQNVIKDSSGCLLSAHDESGYNTEYGNNLFAILNTGEKCPYIRRTDTTGVSYITGNTFYSRDVTYSGFVSNCVYPRSSQAWVSSSLRMENPMSETAEDPEDSIQFSVQTFLQNYLGTIPSDSITEVGFEFRVFPDSSNWTTRRITHVNSDSLYHWWVRIGQHGGVVSYVYWAKDGHGRFITSPLNSDTTSPDTVNCNFLTFAMTDTLIESGTVTIYAPTVITRPLYVRGTGRLVIKPWPGLADHTVTLAPGAFISVYPEYSPATSVLSIEGTESMPITLTSASDSLTWEAIWFGNSTRFEAQYTTIRACVYPFGSFGRTVYQMDHCTFDGSSTYIYVEGADSSYFRDCVFRNIGEEDGFGSVVFDNSTLEFTNCDFENNLGYGVYLYECWDTHFDGCRFRSNSLCGFGYEGWASAPRITCSEFSGNGGDSTSEVYVNGGLLDMSDGAACTFRDSGPLIWASSATNLEIDDGENGLYLEDSAGTFITLGDTSAGLDLSDNYWYPFDPDSDVFWNHMVPSREEAWTSTGIADAVGTCGESEMRIVNGGMLGASSSSGQGRNTMDSQSNSPAGKLMSSTPLASSKKTQRPPLHPLIQSAMSFQQSHDYASAAQVYRSFIESHLEDSRTASVLPSHFVCAKKAGSIGSLASYYSDLEKRLEAPVAKKIAHWLVLESLAIEGRPQAALSGYEEIIQKPASYSDSVSAVIGSMSVLLRYGSTQSLSPMYPENKVASFAEFARRATALSASLLHKGAGAKAAPAISIPTTYQLYQNYPNPFNPNTEIRFDLPEAVRVELKVFNILGQEVANLIDDVRPAGTYRVMWDSKSSSGLTVASGVYVYQLKAGKFTDAKKMVLIR